MIDYRSIFIILSIHTIFDFFLQSRWMGENKSKFGEKNSPLLAHIGVYTLGLILMSVCLNLNMSKVFFFVSTNGAFHFITDLITSKISSHFYLKENKQAFWGTIGTDQLLHLLILFGTL